MKAFFRVPVWSEPITQDCFFDSQVQESATCNCDDASSLIYDPPLIFDLGKDIGEQFAVANNETFLALVYAAIAAQNATYQEQPSFSYPLNQFAYLHEYYLQPNCTDTVNCIGCTCQDAPPQQPGAPVSLSLSFFVTLSFRYRKY